MRLRHNVAVPVAGFAGMIALLPLAGSSWYLAPLLLLPFAVMVWGWRSGVDVDVDGLTVRAMIGNRRLPWQEITGFVTRKHKVYAVLSDQRTVSLPAVTPEDVPKLLSAGGQDLVTDTTETDEDQ